MEARYPIPAARHRVEEEILRSRFITTVGFAPTVEDARTFIAEVSAEFADSSHNCWAYLVGSPGSTAQVGMSDDGEPHGTAGRPMLTVLEHSGVGDIVAVVTRYFGGTLLGKGGLVKAYSGGVSYALASLPVIEKVPKAEVAVIIDYSTITLFQRMLPEYEAEVLSEEYGVDVTYCLSLPVEQVERFQNDLADLTNGQAIAEILSAG
jgi:uncharacterized YigZ family protein